MNEQDKTGELTPENDRAENEMPETTAETDEKVTPADTASNAETQAADGDASSPAVAEQPKQEHWLQTHVLGTGSEAKRVILNGLIFQNPTFVLLLGMCPTLAVTTSLQNGLGMGLSTAAVLALSNLVISLLRKVIPSQIRIASYIVIVATFVTAVDLILQAYVPSLSDALGLYIPLIVVNCIILGRAEAFASKHVPGSSFLDGLFMGLGFTGALCILGAVREILGAGTIWGIAIPGISENPVGLILSPCGGFMMLGFLIALVQWIRNHPWGKKKGGASS